MEFSDWVQVKEKTLEMAEKSVPQNHLSDIHKWTTIHIFHKQLSICTHTVVITIFLAWAVRAELQYSVKTEIQKRLALFWNPQSFVDCLIEKSKRYNFFDLESIQRKLSSYYSLDVSRAVFPKLTVHHFLHTNPTKCRFFKGR